ncbi:MAG: S1 RNA-binding domain-containing protein [Acidobacteria bacterium]|nr:S1 RNA-binding domain-containing protein [Acidobacteriota bacterium]
MTPQLPHDSVVPPDAAELPAESGAGEDTPQPPASDATAEPPTSEAPAASDEAEELTQAEPQPPASDATAEPPTSEAPAASDEAEELTQAELEQLIDEYSGEAAPTTGEIRQSTVVKVTSDGIVVDLGLKSEGVVPLGEFTDEEENITAQPGDSIEVLVEASQARDGYIPCSSEGAHRLKLWEQVERAHREQEKVQCRATSRVRGGLEVEINLPGAHARRRPLTGFMPGSQVDLRPVRHWEGFLNRTLTVRVIRLDRHRGNVVVSRRVLLEEEQVQRKKLLEEVIKEGAELKGTVKNLTDYGAFVDLGGVDGLLHITDISYRRLTHPSEALASGQELTVKVLKVEKKKGRVSLGLKQLEPDPWTGVAAKYRTGERVRGRVTHMTDYGAFVEVEPGLEGLIHVSEMSWTRRVRHPSEVLNEGDWVEAAILDVQPAEKRLSLGLRQTEPDPFQAIAAKFPPGSVVEGTVKSLTDFGAFIELEPGVEGLVHLSELSWKKKLKKPSEVLKRGQQVKAKVLRVDVLNRRLSLSLKDLTPDPWATYVSRIRVGKTVHGRVTRRADFGVFVELAEGVEGLCHISELPTDGDEIKAGAEFEFKVIKLNPNERRIGLSLKAMAPEMERRALKDYRASQPRSTATLQEILASKGFTSGMGKS